MPVNFIADNEITKSAINVLEIEASSVSNLKSRINEDFLKAIEILYNSKGKVIVTGMGKSGLIGRKIAATLSSTGTPAIFLHPAESTHGDSGIITREDVVIAISNSGETAELLNLLPLIHRFGIPLISMTGGLNSTLAKRGDVVLNISVEKEACPMNIVPTASTTATLAMGDALAICLLEKRGFGREDFLVYHPSGSLGKGILYTVEELMVKEEKLPIIDHSTSFKNALIEISEKKLGTALIVDDASTLIGILTDGDIRRTLIKFNDTSNLKLTDVMTKNPKTISKTDLCARALSIMEKHSITSLAVVDEKNIPIGIIHIHDLLKAGVA